MSLKLILFSRSKLMMLKRQTNNRSVHVKKTKFEFTKFFSWFFFFFKFGFFFWKKKQIWKYGFFFNLINLSSKELQSYCSLQLSGRQKILFDWNFKLRAFLGPPGSPLLAGSSIPLKSLLKPLSTYYAAQG